MMSDMPGTTVVKGLRDDFAAWRHRRQAEQRIPQRSAADAFYRWSLEPCGRDLSRALALYGVNGYGWETFEA